MNRAPPAGVAAALDRLPPDAEAWHQVTVAGPELQDLQLPGTGRFQGAMRRGDELWLCRGDRIYRTHCPSGEVLADASCHWVVGPERPGSMDLLEQQLRRIYTNRATWVAGADGESAPIPILLEPYPGVKVGQVASTWDLCREIGFTSIRSPTLEAWAREHAKPR